MFRNIEFYDNYTGHLFSPWWMYLLMGFNFVLMAILIFMFPDFLAYLVAAFLLVNGIVMVALAFQVRSLRKNYHRWRKKFWVDAHAQ
ncbi:MAG: hypothetical protein D6730_14950 [Bacteroidetes bacterium]|nr:MAG: hypothetical protein D6730_14950 [Bacteroidota bacterium]